MKTTFMNFVQDIHLLTQEDTQEGVEQRQHAVCAARKESSGEQVGRCFIELGAHTGCCKQSTMTAAQRHALCRDGQ